MRSILAFLLFSLCSAVSAHACSCIGPTRCGVLRHGDVLFLGKVTTRDIVDHQMKFGAEIGHRQTFVFHITALENFAGDQHVGQEVLIATGNGGGDCGYPFTIGETYLVDAYLSEGVLNTGICNITAPAVTSTVALREFRTLAAGRRLPDLTGLVGIPAGNSLGFPPTLSPLSSTPITITSDEGTPRKTLTDSEGVYTFPMLPPGKYTVDAALPSELTTRETEISKKPIRIEVPNVSGAGSACREDIIALPAGSISGFVLDESGKAIPGFVSVHSIDGPQKDRLVAWGGSGEIGPDGSFTLHFVAEGSYQVQFTPRADFSQRWFYPGTLAEGNAKSILVQSGQHLRDLRFILPAPVATPQK